MFGDRFSLQPAEPYTADKCTQSNHLGAVIQQATDNPLQAFALVS